MLIKIIIEINTNESAFDAELKIGVVSVFVSWQVGRKRTSTQASISH